MAAAPRREGPLVYEVTARVEPALRERYERFMRERHIPDVLASGAFSGATLERAESGVYRVRYVARDHAALERYLADIAPGLRVDFAHQIPEGVELTRETLATLQRWVKSPESAPG